MEKNYYHDLCIDSLSSCTIVIVTDNIMMSDGDSGGPLVVKSQGKNIVIGLPTPCTAMKGPYVVIKDEALTTPKSLPSWVSYDST